MPSSWNDRQIDNHQADKAHLQIGISAISNNNMPIEGRLALVPQYDWSKVEPLPGQADFWKRLKEQL